MNSLMTGTCEGPVLFKHPCSPDWPVTGKFRRLLLPVLLVLVFSACQRDSVDLVPEPEYLVEAELIGSFSKDDILSTLEETDVLPPGLAAFVNYGVSVYKITYLTPDTDNENVLASGALVIPDESVHLPLMSFQHGTLQSNEHAPSYFSSDSYFPAVLYASTGYVISLPDYLGYGTSSHLDHPYEHGHSLATASRDMLRAVREFDNSNNEFNLDNNLFLTGYSQGGYATMALLKLLEEEHLGEFSITASTAGAGAYNKSEFARYILEWEGELPYLNNFLWVLETYDRVYGLKRDAGYYFNEPYATVIASEGVFANTQMNPQELFSESFINGILNETDTGFIEALSDNDNYNWKPLSPLRLYHGTDDNYVFYFNSETAWEAMKELGAHQVELIPVVQGDHHTTIYDYLMGTFLFFNEF
jgi:pimeloyl-ACP methyl ester carboxylesterase